MSVKRKKFVSSEDRAQRGDEQNRFCDPMVRQLDTIVGCNPLSGRKLHGKWSAVWEGAATIRIPLRTGGLGFETVDSSSGRCIPAQLVPRG